ncbi:MAG: peptidoglycan DL-endopeptidase CwlO, partial [Pseudonocardiales bacterium]|nr:peptidoglycan DL-endopeptidase CwlO [Pseudonocardiales bacterium]
SKDRHQSRGTARPEPVPVAVALDPSLSRPQPGDTEATRRARVQLAGIGDAYQTANQLYDQASADADTAADEVSSARKAVATAVDQATRAHAEFALLITAQYRGAGTPIEAQLLAADGKQDFLSSLDLQRAAAVHNADVLTAARDTQTAAEEARQRLEAAEAAAEDAQSRANLQLAAASAALAAAQRTVNQLHDADLAAAAAARESNLGAGAAAIQAAALASGAARPGMFAESAGPAQTIAIATRALLEQAARHPAKAALDDAPVLGQTVPYTGTTGSGPVLSLTPFDGVPSTAGWPNEGVGTKVRGTAPFQKSDGKTVHPELPGYAEGYSPLRAEVAVDAALEQLGSPYVWDAAGPDTFDCSGLTLWAWGHAGVPLTHFTGDQVHEGVLVAPDELLPGDLLLFGRTLHHVGMYLGAGYMIDAPTTGDYVKVQLVSDDGDLAVAVRP